MAATKDVFQKVLKIVRNYNFARDVRRQLKDGNITVYNYGSPGSLMRQNILQEWILSTILKQENSFLVNNSSIIDKDCNTDRNEDSFYYLRRGLVEGCKEQFLSMAQKDWKLPLVIGSVGTVFCDTEQNDIFLLNGQERTQMTVSHFCTHSTVTQSFDFWQQYRLQWWRQFSTKPVHYSITGSNKTENSQLQADIIYQFPWGQEVIESVSNHGSIENNHANKHSKNSGVNMIECTTDLETCLLIFLFDSFLERSKPTKSGSTQMRQFLQLHTHLAPYKVSVVIAGTRINELKAVGRKLQNDFRLEGIVLLNNQFHSVAAAEQVTRNDHLGIPYTVILKDQTLENGITLLRNRDTTIKQEIHISRLTEVLKRNIRPGNKWPKEKKVTKQKEPG